MAKYPLLIQGVWSNQAGTVQSIVPGGSLTNAGWSNNLKSGRGDLVAIDPITTFIDAYDQDTYLGEFSYYVGSETVIQSAPFSRYVPANKPRSNELLQLRQPGGQSVRLSFNNDATGPGIMVHHYFENWYATKEIIAARQNPVLKPRIKDFVLAVPAATKLTESQNFAVPTGLGNVIAVELIGERVTTTVKTMMTGLVTVVVGGTEIFQDVNLGITVPAAGRPGLIFPILIRPSETFVIKVDTTNLTGTARVYLRLYFDDDRAGTREYATNQDNC